MAWEALAWRKEALVAWAKVLAGARAGAPDADPGPSHTDALVARVLTLTQLYEPNCYYCVR